MTLKTFEDWSNLGYRIIKGSKARSRTPYGIALFEDSQVYKPNTETIILKGTATGRTEYNRMDILRFNPRRHTFRVNHSGDISEDERQLDMDMEALHHNGWGND